MLPFGGEQGLWTHLKVRLKGQLVRPRAHLDCACFDRYRDICIHSPHA